MRGTFLDLAFVHRLEFGEILLVQGTRLAETHALQIELVIIDRLSCRTVLGEEEDDRMPTSREHLLRQIENPIETTLVEEHPSNRHGRIIGIREERVLDDDRGTALLLELGHEVLHEHESGLASRPRRTADSRRSHRRDRAR